MSQGITKDSPLWLVDAQLRPYLLRALDCSAYNSPVISLPWSCRVSLYTHTVEYSAKTQENVSADLWCYFSVCLPPFKNCDPHLLAASGPQTDLCLLNLVKLLDCALGLEIACKHKARVISGLTSLMHSLTDYSLHYLFPNV